MQFLRPSTSELELLILDVLLPVYEKYQKSLGIPEPFREINPNLLKQLTTKKRLAALFRPIEN